MRTVTPQRQRLAQMARQLGARFVSAAAATAEVEARTHCAAGYRLASRFKWDTGSIYNHITVRSGGDEASGEPHFLVRPTFRALCVPVFSLLAEPG
jgi:hypothetical protein